MRLATFFHAAFFLPACLLGACSGGTPVAEPGATELAAMVEKNCNDPHWREQNSASGIRSAGSRCAGSQPRLRIA